MKNFLLYVFCLTGSIACLPEPGSKSFALLPQIQVARGGVDNDFSTSHLYWSGLKIDANVSAPLSISLPPYQARASIRDYPYFKKSETADEPEVSNQTSIFSMQMAEASQSSGGSAGKKPSEERIPLSISNTKPLRIRSSHWAFDLPLQQRGDKILLIHDIFTVFFDLEKKFPVYLAYRLNPNLIYGSLKLKRDYVPDPALPEGSFLSYKDYTGASTCDKKAKQGYDKGHLAPLGSFKGSNKAWQANYLSNIVPQFRSLNQGPWRILEETVRSFVKQGHEAWILTGPLYGQEGGEGDRDKLAPCWRAAQGKVEEIPSHYWKIIARQKGSKVEACSFLMPQHVRNRRVSPKRFIVPYSQIKTALGMSLFNGSGSRRVQEACGFLFDDLS